MKLVQSRCQSRLALVLIVVAALVTLGSACANSTVKSTASSSPSGKGSKAVVIHYLTAQREAAPLGRVRMACTATSQENAAITYKWSATGGRFDGEGPSVAWLAPAATGDYVFTVTVADSKGNQASRSAGITVTQKPNWAPVVNKMICHDCSDGMYASRWSEYHIECDASDPEGDELTYVWLATLGQIEAEGENATWQTFGEYGNVLIKVIVADERGNETEGYLAINLKCCN